MIFRHAVDQPNRSAFRCRANVNGERVAICRAAGKLFQINGTVTAKLLIPSVVLVLGTDSIPVCYNVLAHVLQKCPSTQTEQTATQTTLHVTSVVIGCIYVLHAMQAVWLNNSHVVVFYSAPG